MWSELPSAYAHPGDAGADLAAAEAVTLKPAAAGRWSGPAYGRDSRRLRRLRVAPQRPGAQARRDVSQHAGPDRRGYRGEVKVLLVNTDPTTDYTVEVGDRIAQLVIQAVAQADVRCRRRTRRPPARRGRVRSTGRA